MEISKAIRLIEKAFSKTRSKQIWADLGAGGGLFTNALARLVDSGSVIYAVDKDSRAINNLQLSTPGVLLNKVNLDFIKVKQFNLEPLDGVLMANSLHYVKDKPEFIHKLKRILKPSGILILVEYDTEQSNPWVPYPLSYVSLQDLVVQTGIRSLVKLDQTPSLYGQGHIYSALLSF